LQDNTLYDIVPRVKQRIINSFTPDALDIYEREFRFFAKVTAISGVLYPLPKDKRRAQIRR
jgi:phosphatidylinositol 4-kinase